MRTPNVIAAMAGFGAGLVAALVAVALSAAGGAFEFGTTVTERVAAPAPLVPVPSGSAGAVPGFDAGAVYRARIAGVVTISSVLPAGGEIGGSGFVVSGDGLILTNAHVVTNSGDTGVQPSGVHQAQHVYVQFSNEDKVEARVVGYDLFDDVALVRVDPSGLTLHPVPLGNSSNVRVGQPVAAIGSPFSQAGSLSVGVVSAVNRSIPSLVTR
ncbi:MAG: S1C family serine protease, partial [Gaiellales bacterium]